VDKLEQLKIPFRVSLAALKPYNKISIKDLRGCSQVLGQGRNKY